MKTASNEFSSFELKVYEIYNITDMLENKIMSLFSDR